MAESASEPPDFEAKLYFLQTNEVPRAILGHKGSQQSFCDCLGVKRATLRGQIERKKLLSDTQRTIAQKLRFRVDWTEWTSGTLHEFKQRYLDEHRHVLERLSETREADPVPFNALGDEASGGRIPAGTVKETIRDTVAEKEGSRQTSEKKDGRGVAPRPFRSRLHDVLRAFHDNGPTIVGGFGIGLGIAHFIVSDAGKLLQQSVWEGRWGLCRHLVWFGRHMDRARLH